MIGNELASPPPWNYQTVDHVSYIATVKLRAGKCARSCFSRHNCFEGNHCLCTFPGYGKSLFSHLYQFCSISFERATDFRLDIEQLHSGKTAQSKLGQCGPRKRWSEVGKFAVVDLVPGPKISKYSLIPTYLHLTDMNLSTPLLINSYEGIETQFDAVYRLFSRVNESPWSSQRGIIQLLTICLLHTCQMQFYKPSAKILIVDRKSRSYLQCI
jgi:hypothetical protein